MFPELTVEGASQGQLVLADHCHAMPGRYAGMQRCEDNGTKHMVPMFVYNKAVRS